MPVTLHHGDNQLSLPGETLAADVVGGSVASKAGSLCIASVSEESGRFYEGWKYPNVGAIYKAPKALATVFADGDDVNFDITNDLALTTGGDGKIGVAIVDANGFGGGTNADEFVYFVHRDW